MRGIRLTAETEGKDMRYTPTVAQIRLTDNGGMSYAIRLCDGSYIMIDGGESDKDGSGSYEQNSRVLMNYLKRHTDGDIRIRCWFITHFHLDHIDHATDFLKAHSDVLRVDAFAYNHPGLDERLRDEERIRDWECAMDKYPTALRRILKAGETISFPGLEAEILLAEGVRAPENPADQNNISAAIRFKFDTGRAFVVLGDCCTERLYALSDPASPRRRADEDIRCDVLQAAHHGLVMGNDKYINLNRTLYERMSPSITFFPTHPDRFSTHRCFTEPKYTDNVYLMESTKYYHHRITTVVSMDDLTVAIEDEGDLT